MQQNMHDPIKAINGTTSLFGCIACPTDHVRAPIIFNSIFTKREINAVMLPVDISPEQLEEGIKGLKALKNFKGAAVTIPHKLTLAALCDELGPGARAAAAVNAVHFTDDGRLLGDNFDGHGFVAGLMGENPLNAPDGQILQDKAILIIGAGGAARAIALSLAEQPVSRVDVTNRTHRRAEEAVQLVKKLRTDANVSAIERADIDFQRYDIVINATPLGLNENDEMPLDINLLQTSCLVCDIIMIPEQTRLIDAARQSGRPVHIGRYMLDYQVDLIGEFIGAYKKNDG